MIIDKKGVESNISVFCDNLLKKTEYNRLQISLNFDFKSNESNTDNLIIMDNAFWTLKGSAQATEEIRTYAKTLMDNCPQDKLILTITFSKRRDDVRNVELFTPIQPKYKFSDVILNQDTLEEIRNYIDYIPKADLIYDTWNWKSKDSSSRTIFCFYGEPGTGKTMCAHAIAHELKRKILIAPYEIIQSEYVGVGAKNLAAAFEQAEKEDAVLFFDEADSFLRKRTSDTNSSASMHYNSMTNVMMQHLENFKGVVIFATNLMETTDKAFKTRITSSIRFDVPNLETRAKIIKVMIPNELPLLTTFEDGDYMDMAEECDGFVGRDIRNAIKEIINIGAIKDAYPFTKDSFIDGFRRYRDKKERLDKDISNPQNNDLKSQLDLSIENGNVIALLTYAAWINGKESNEATEYLKDVAKILGRKKPIITKIEDLPSLDELCEKIQTESIKIKTVKYIAELLSKKENPNNVEFISMICKKLGLSEQIIYNIIEYYSMMLRIAKISDSLH